MKNFFIGTITGLSFIFLLANAQVVNEAITPTPIPLPKPEVKINDSVMLSRIDKIIASSTIDITSAIQIDATHQDNLNVIKGLNKILEVLKDIEAHVSQNTK